MIVALTYSLFVFSLGLLLYGAFAHDPTREAMEGYGEVESLEGRDARLLVRRDQLTATVGRLLAERDVTDLTVSDPPVEQIIARMFREGTPEHSKSEATPQPTGT